MAFWVYSNWVHKYAKVHDGACGYCNDGRGIHDRGSDAVASEWLGPFRSAAEALGAARQTGHDPQTCRSCGPG